MRICQVFSTQSAGKKTRQIVKLLFDSSLEGRDSETLKEWLKNHQRIKLVVRDRAGAYARAINDILPDCVQVADRFHLLQNLIERMCDIFKDEIPNEIFIKGGKILDYAPEKVKRLKIDPDSEQLNRYDYDNKMPIDENGNPVKYDNKKRNFDCKQYKEQTENRKKNNG